MFASVGFEIACADADLCCVETHTAGRASREELRGSDRVMVLRSMVGVEMYKRENEGLESRLIKVGVVETECQWVGRLAAIDLENDNGMMLPCNFLKLA